jgi:CMP-N,N'-diacetyllegionaminic acid synthase
MLTEKKPYILGIIPARGGSKRLTRKNVKLLNGRPLIDYVIKAGGKCDLITKLIVSTDDEEIKQVALSCGANVPFLRPKELAKDSSTTEEVIKHSILTIERSFGNVVDAVVILQPTSPFTSVKMINQCLEMLINENWDTVVTVQEVHKRCEWIGLLEKDQRFLQIINEENYFDLLEKKEYSPSGNVYVCKRNVIFEQKKVIGENTGAIVVPDKYAIDIDRLIDFQFAEYLLEKGEFSQEN